jgi:hypothetical protein
VLRAGGTNVKRTLLFGFVSLATLVTGMLMLRPSRLKADDSPADRQGKVLIGLSIAPVRLNLEGKNPILVGLGSYYVNAQGACVDCHSCPTYEPGHNPFPPPVGTNGDGKLNALNYLAGGVPFPLPPPAGTIRSPNLTPDASGLPAGITFQQFLTALRTGAEPHDPEERMTIMPWPTYRYMTDGDLRAIYEYLRAIPRAQPGSCMTTGQ